VTALAISFFFITNGNTSQQRMLTRLLRSAAPRYTCSRAISNCTSLGAQVNSLTQQIKAPKTGSKGLFGNQLLSHWNGFYVFRQNAIVDAEALVREATSPTRTRKMVQVFDELSNCLCKVADLSEFVR